MTKKTALLLLSILAAVGAELKDPRSLEFPARLEFTPHQVERFTLSNGIEVFLAEDHEVPVVTFYFLVRAGENRVPADYAGLARLLARLVVEGGSRTVPKRVFEDSLENFGASFSGQAGTQEATFVLHLLTEHIRALLPMVAGVLRDPALPQSQLDINKEQYLAGYRGRNTEPSRVARRVASKLLYGKDSPEAREVTPATLDNINLAKLREFHNANYRPEHVMIGVAGDFESKVMLDLLERWFGDWPEPDVEPWPASPIYTDPAPAGVYCVHWPGSIQSSIYMGYPGIVRSDERYPVSRLFTEIYGGSWSSRLHTEVRDERGLAYLVWGALSSDFDEPGAFRTTALTKSQSTLKAVKLILSIIEDMKRNGVTPEELELAKSSWLASFPAYYADPEGVMRDRMNYAAHGYPIDFWDKLPDRIEPLSADEVSRFAAEFLKPEDLRIFVLGDTTAFDGSLFELGEVHLIDPEEY